MHAAQCILESTHALESKAGLERLWNPARQVPVSQWIQSRIETGQAIGWARVIAAWAAVYRSFRCLGRREVSGLRGTFQHREIYDTNSIGTAIGRK